MNRNLTQRQAVLLLVAVLDLVKYSIKVSNAMLKIIYVAMKICATIIVLVLALHNNIINSKKLLNYVMRAVFNQAFFSLKYPSF
jgi:hypothetical protein